MTATEELRRLLDERGVEYDEAAAVISGVVATFWHDRNGYPCSAIEGADDIQDGKLSVQALLIPAQAADATLGRGTTTRTSKYRTKYGRSIPVCERCGYGIGDMRWNFCPSCGAEVVDE